MMNYVPNVLSTMKEKVTFAVLMIASFFAFFSTDTTKFSLYACVIVKNDAGFETNDRLKTIRLQYNTMEECETAMVLFDKQIVREISLGIIPPNVVVYGDVAEGFVMYGMKIGKPGTFVNFD